MSNQQRHFYWLSRAVNIWFCMNGCVLVALKCSPCSNAECNFWFLITRINPQGSLQPLKVFWKCGADFIEHLAQSTDGKSHRLGQHTFIKKNKINKLKDHFLIWPMMCRHYHCWASFNCRLQMIYSLHQSNTHAQFSRKFITASWFLPKRYKPKAKGRTHTIF